MAAPAGVGSNEIWVGNTERPGRKLDELRAAGVTSARLGDVALDVDGKKLPSYFAPLIISKAQEMVYDDHMMRKTFGPHWRR